MNDTNLTFPSTTSVAAMDPIGDTAALAPWSHNLHLPNGTRTAPDHPLGDYPNNRWEQIRDFIPDDLAGCTALDIGCNAGFFAIELARRGAQVTAIDRDVHVLRQARWAIQQYGLQDRITLYHGEAYDLAQWDQTFDVVLFFDFFDRVRYPLLALDLAARLVKHCFVFQGRTMPGDEVEITPDNLPAEDRAALTRPGWPKMAFIEKSIAGDARSWWAPNRAAAEAMLRSTGLEIVARPGDEIFLCQPRDHGAFDQCLSADELRSATGSTSRKPKRFDDEPEPESAPITIAAETAA